MTAAVTVRELGAGELELLAPLWSELLAHHAAVAPLLSGLLPPREADDSWWRRREQYERWLAERPAAFAALAVRGLRPVGYAFVTVGPGLASWRSGERIAELETLTVAASERRRGIATMLLDFATARLAAIGVTELSVTTTAENADARGFYEARGLRSAHVIYFGPLAAQSGGRGRPGAPPPLRALDHVQLAAPAGCETAARRFYGGLLGLSEIVKPASLRGRGGVWFELGAQQLHIGVEDGFAAARKAHPAVRVGNHELDELARRLADGGATVVWDATLADTRRFFTADPWGNRLEILARC